MNLDKEDLFDKIIKAMNLIIPWCNAVKEFDDKNNLFIRTNTAKYEFLDCAYGGGNRFHWKCYYGNRKINRKDLWFTVIGTELIGYDLFLNNIIESEISHNLDKMIEIAEDNGPPNT